MKFLYASLLLLSAHSFGTEIIPLKWDLATYGQGASTPKKAFDSYGPMTFEKLETQLSWQGGFDTLYKKFQSEEKPFIRVGVWQEAQAFQEWLKNCELNMNVPVDQLVIRLGVKSIFESKNDQEVFHVLEELAPQLSTEKKIELVSLVGGVFLSNYDYDRAGGKGTGAVTMRELIGAAQNGKDAGVCRDMAQAQAVMLKKLGLDQTYIVAYQTAGGGHATVLIQDPENSKKTHVINYNFPTSTETSSSLSHLKQDTNIPSVGTNMQIYSAEGRPLGSLPTHLGVLLTEMAGGRAQDLDPMVRSENLLAGVTLGNNRGFRTGAGVGATPDGDKVLAMSVGYTMADKNLPGRMGMVIYKNERETHNRGTLTSAGAFLSYDQKVQPNPVTIRTSQGEFKMRPYAKAGFDFNFSRNELSGSTAAPATSWRTTLRAGAGIESEFSSPNGETRINGKAEMIGEFIKGDVRNEDSTKFQPTIVSGTLRATQKVSDQVSAYGEVIVTKRRGLGTQSRQEIGVVSEREGSRVGVALGHEGQIQGEGAAFIPGSRHRYTADVTYAKGDRYRLSGGGHCTKDREDCGVRATATVKIGPRPQQN